MLQQYKCGWTLCVYSLVSMDRSDLLWYSFTYFIKGALSAYASLLSEESCENALACNSVCPSSLGLHALCRVLGITRRHATGSRIVGAHEAHQRAIRAVHRSCHCGCCVQGDHALHMTGLLQKHVRRTCEHLANKDSIIANCFAVRMNTLYDMATLKISVFSCCAPPVAFVCSPPV